MDLPTTTVLMVFLLTVTAGLTLGLLKSKGGPCLPYVYVVMVVLESVVIKAVYYMRNREMRERVFAMYQRILGISSQKAQP